MGFNWKMSWRQIGLGLILFGCGVCQLDIQGHKDLLQKQEKPKIEVKKEKSFKQDDNGELIDRNSYYPPPVVGGNNYQQHNPIPQHNVQPLQPVQPPADYYPPISENLTPPINAHAQTQTPSQSQQYYVPGVPGGLQYGLGPGFGYNYPEYAQQQPGGYPSQIQDPNIYTSQIQDPNIYPSQIQDPSLYANQIQDPSFYASQIQNPSLQQGLPYQPAYQNSQYYPEYRSGLPYGELYPNEYLTPKEYSAPKEYLTT